MLNLIRVKTDVMRDRINVNINRVTNKKLIVIGLEPEDVKNRSKEQDDKEEQEESERTEDESSEYEDIID